MDTPTTPSRMNRTHRFVLTCAAVLLFGCSTGNTADRAAPSPAGAHRLAPCPQTPNCVSSVEPAGSSRYIPPLEYTGGAEAARRNLAATLKAFPRARIVVDRARYLRAEFRSTVFGFVDDVEFLFPPDRSVVEVRSASRSGYYDFGKNRERIEDVRRRWNENSHGSGGPG